jgi:Xaa-Pro aminopeptidase
MFSIHTYTRRRAALVQALADRGTTAGTILFPGSEESPVNYPDNCYRFRQDSSFLYYFGIQEPGLAATLDLDTGRTQLYADEQSLDSMVWSGPRPGASDFAAACGADAVRPRNTLKTDLAALKGLVHFLPQYRGETILYMAEELGLAPASLRQGSGLALIQAVIAGREIKEPQEIVQIEAAVDTSIDMHRAVIGAAWPGATEAQLMALASQLALAGGGRPSFPPIATTQGAVLHNHGYGGTLADGGLFLLDSGAETPEGYAGDLTSTFPIGPRYNERQKAIYRIVLEAGKTAVEHMKPGLPFKTAHLAASRTIATGLKDLGIMKGDAEEAVAAGAHALFFCHGLGHQMGLDVHDLESLGEIHVGYEGEARSTKFGLKSLRMAKALKPGMVMTVEPGIYFIPGLIARWKAEGTHQAFIDYKATEAWSKLGGYRNEEDWLITETGARKLGKPFDKSPEAMEAYKSP